MARIELQNIAKNYGSVEVMRDINLEIEDGEFIVLVGPSGCGKSTLLRMIAGLEPITDGEFRVDGRRMNEVQPRDRDMAMVFQSYALYPHMDVARNMGFSLEIRKAPSQERAGKVHDAAKTLGLTSLTARLPKALSGGQRQRVAMGRAIVRDPSAFLFDEPLSNLDAKLRVQMRVEIKRLQRALGTTSVYVTHDQLEAMTLADRLVVLNGGNIEQIGAPIEVYDNPASTFVASFIGSPAMNLLEVKANGDGLELVKGTGLSGANVKGGDGYTVGIRPEHMEVVDSASAGGGLTLEVTVNVLEPVGAESFIYASFEEGGPELVVRVSSHAVHPAGEKLTLKVAPEHVHYFDAQTGRRID